MQSRVIEITPEQALSWLQANTFNRTISPSVVKKYASDMASGNWTLNHQGIAFDDDGVLVDGQHRLMAMVESGQAIKTLVSFGSNRTGIDELRARLPHEVIKFGAMSDWIGRGHIATAKSALAIFTKSSGVASTCQLVEFCNKYQDGLLFVDEHFRSNRKGISSAFVKAVFMVASYHFNHDKLGRMISILYSGVADGVKESAAIKARDMIIAGEFYGGSTHRSLAAKKLSKAVKAFVSDTPISRLYQPADLSFTMPTCEEQQ
jgi:hypothetical protein